MRRGSFSDGAADGRCRGARRRVVDGSPSRRRSEFQRRAQATPAPRGRDRRRDARLPQSRLSRASGTRRDRAAGALRAAAVAAAAHRGSATSGPTRTRSRRSSRSANLALRPTDTLARWQGGELVVLLPSTGLAGASRFARRLCAHVAASGLAAGRPLAASIGVATALGRQEGLELLIQRARGRPGRGARRRRRPGRHRLSRPTRRACLRPGPCRHSVDAADRFADWRSNGVHMARAAISLTPAAASRVRELMATKGDGALGLRAGRQAVGLLRLQLSAGFRARDRAGRRGGRYGRHQGGDRAARRHVRARHRTRLRRGQARRAVRVPQSRTRRRAAAAARASPSEASGPPCPR